MDFVQRQFPSSSQTQKNELLSALFIETLVCPICKGKLEITQGFLCVTCSRDFQKSPFPIFLEEINLSDALKNQAQAYTAVAASLEQAGTASFASFLNFGYVANQNRRRSKKEPRPHVLNKNSVRLLYEVIGEIELNGENVLEIGCGRGGNVATITNQFLPKMAVGLDLCIASINHCQSVHSSENFWFCVGEAQHLPFGNETFGVVVNIESSHAYPDIREFFNEVKRVLRPGGFFLYSDLLRTEVIPVFKAYLRDIGFDLIRDEDISENVLLSCDQIAAQRKQGYAAVRNAQVNRLLDEFLAVPGSRIYEQLKRGATRYFNLAFSKK